MNYSQIIENKVDTAEKLAAAAGKPTNNFLFAPEINELVARIRLLWTLQNFDHTALIPAVKKDLGTLVGQTFIEKINTSAAVAYPSPCFVVYTIDGVEYVQGFVGVAGNYGTGQGQVNASQFVLLYQSDEVLPSNPHTRQIFYGDLSGYDFTAFKNTLGYEVTCVQDGDYAKTNIPLFPTTSVQIENRLQLLSENENIYTEYYNVGGYLAFRNIYTDSLGGVTYVELNHSKILIEQL